MSKGNRTCGRKTAIFFSQTFSGRILHYHITQNSYLRLSHKAQILMTLPQFHDTLIVSGGMQPYCRLKKQPKQEGNK